MVTYPNAKVMSKDKFTCTNPDGCGNTSPVKMIVCGVCGHDTDWRDVLGVGDSKPKKIATSTTTRKPKRKTQRK